MSMEVPMKDIFTRSRLNPILRPRGDWWKIYNPAAALDDNGKVHLFPRVMKKEEDWHSRIAHAISDDGEHFTWDSEPVLVREGEDEKRGLEDPRITRIGNIYYMAFAVYDGKNVVLHTATARDLGGPWHRQGPALPDFNFFESGGVNVHWEHGKPVEVRREGDYWSKSGAYFPELLGGRYNILFGDFYIWLATSEDGIVFQADTKPLIGSRKVTSCFDNTFVEMGPPPILTEKGWLVLYHGIDNAFRYQLGFLILDREDPHKIIYRCDEPIFGPKEEYELGDALIDVMPGGVEAMRRLSDSELKDFYKKVREDNIMPQVTFCPGTVLRDGMLWLYYGSGDTSICTAWAPLQEILKLVD